MVAPCRSLPETASMGSDPASPGTRSLDSDVVTAAAEMLVFDSLDLGGKAISSTAAAITIDHTATITERTLFLRLGIARVKLSITSTHMPRSSDPTTEDYWHALINQSAIRFFILRVLWEKDSYGYILSKEVKEMSWGFCEPTESTLYPALAKLEQEKLIFSTKVASKSRTRKMYSITETGKDAFRVAAKVWNHIIPALRQNTTL